MEETEENRVEKNLLTTCLPSLKVNENSITLAVKADSLKSLARKVFQLGGLEASKFSEDELPVLGIPPLHRYHDSFGLLLHNHTTTHA